MRLPLFTRLDPIMVGLCVPNVFLLNSRSELDGGFTVGTIRHF